MTINTTVRPPYAVHNSELGRLIREQYGIEDVRQILAAFAAHNTLTLRRFSSGGAAAITILDDQSLEAAIGDDLIRMWDRDNIIQALGEFVASINPELARALKVPADSWKRGLWASLRHHHLYGEQFVAIIDGRVSGLASEAARHPAIRYNPVSLKNVKGDWGHKQNDAHGAINFLLFWQLNAGRLAQSDLLTPEVSNYAALLHALLWKVHVWEDHDVGAWEDKVAEHWSSIAMVAVSLAEQMEFVRNQGSLKCHAYERRWLVRENDLWKLLDHCMEKLEELGTSECTRPFNREVDLAQLNPLLMQALANRQLIDDETVLAIVEKVEGQLAGEHGIRRFLDDDWDGREHRDDLADGEEAQWFHGYPTLSVILGSLYRRTGDEQFLEWQSYCFSRTLAAVTDGWRIPEAWIVDRETRQWVPDANVPLAWGQSVTIMAIDSMLASLNRQAAISALSAPPGPLKSADHELEDGKNRMAWIYSSRLV